MTKQEEQVFLNILHEYRDEIQHLNNDLDNPELHSLLESYQLLTEEEDDKRHKKGHGDRAKSIKSKLNKINIKIKDLERKKKEKEITLKTKKEQLQVATRAIQKKGERGQQSISIGGESYNITDLQKEIGTLNKELYGESVTPFLDVKEKMYLEFIMSLKEPLFKSNINQLDETCNRFIEVIKYVELNEDLKGKIEKIKNRINDPSLTDEERNTNKETLKKLEAKLKNQNDSEETSTALVKKEPEEEPKTNDPKQPEETSPTGSITDRLEDLYDKRSELKDELGNSPSAKKDFTNFLMKKGGSIMSTLGTGLQAVVGAVLFKAIFNP